MFERKEEIIADVLTILPSLLLLVFAPNNLSRVFVVAMMALLACGIWFGYRKASKYRQAFNRARKAIKKSENVESDSLWLVTNQADSIFHEKDLDRVFDDYRAEVNRKRLRDFAVVDDIEDYVNEDVLATWSWKSTVQQITGTLTGLGLLGTFIGLIIGISGIGFSSAEVAIASLQELINGIEIAFYTSIAGMILSIIFNLSYKTLWNLMMRSYSMFLYDFHKKLVKSEEEQKNDIQEKFYDTALKKIEDVHVAAVETSRKVEAISLPASSSHKAFSAGVTGPLLTGSTGNMMVNNVLNKTNIVEIANGIDNGEFIVYFQPKCDIETKNIVGAEVLARWNHPEKGILPPIDFIPILEENDQIAEFDAFIWETVFKTVRRWLDEGLEVLPVSINLSKEDVKNKNVIQEMAFLLEAYKVPASTIEIEISEKIYEEMEWVVRGIEGGLRRLGFKVTMDNYSGKNGTSILADSMKISAAFLDSANYQRKVQELMAEHIEVMAEHVETTPQVEKLKEMGCRIVQGYYYYEPMPCEDYEKLVEEQRPIVIER